MPQKVTRLSGVTRITCGTVGGRGGKIRCLTRSRRAPYQRRGGVRVPACMRKLWTYVVVAIAVPTAAVALGCASANAKIAPSLPGAANARVLTQAADGFYQLETDWQRTPSTNRAPRVAQAPNELADLWSAFALSGKPPTVDFHSHLVLGFSKPDPCYATRIKGLVLTSLAELRVLVLEHTGKWACVGDDRETVWVVAVSRAALPEQFDFASPARETVHVIQRTAANQAELVQVTTDAAPKPTHVLGHVPKPAPGRVRLARLDDGTPAWVVAHEDGSFDVLDPLRDSPEYCGVTGVREIVRYDASSRLFGEEWDEYGVDIYAARKNLPRYAVELDPAHPELLVVGERVAPSRRSFARPAAGPLAPPLDLELGPTQSLEAAKAAPSGTVVLLDATLVFGPDGVRLCKMDPEERRPICPEGSPEVASVVASKSPLKCGMFGAPVLARLDQGKFTDITPLGANRKCGFSYEMLKKPDEARPYVAVFTPPSPQSASPPALQKRRLSRWSAPMGAYLTAAYQSGHFLPFGSEAQIGIKYDFEVLENAELSDAVANALLGDNVGVMLRGRVASGSVNGRISTVAALSVATWILNDIGWYRVPTLLSPLAPEVGLLVRSPGPAAVFLGFSAPVGYAQYQLVPSLVWLPASGETLFSLSAGLVME